MMAGPDEFLDCLQKYCGALGWSDITFSTNYDPLQTTYAFPNAFSSVTLSVRCLHGVSIYHHVSHAFIEGGAPAAAAVGKDLMHLCTSTHELKIGTPGEYKAQYVTNYMWITVPKWEDEFTKQYIKTYQENLAKAYGAAVYRGNKVTRQLAALVPDAATVVQKCPECLASGPILSLIPHINDRHRWSREKIADWLETLDVDLTIRPKEKDVNANAGTQERRKPRRFQYPVGGGESCKWGDEVIG